MRGGADLAERGVIFEGLTGLGGAVAPVAPNDRSSRRLMTRLAARQRLQREGGTVRRLRERETVAFRRALYRCGIRVRGVAGNQGQQQRDITAESFRRNPAHLNRLRPWLRRELTVLYGAHAALVDIVQRIIMARLARHGLEDTPTIEDELRPFLLARTDHFLHELVSFARSPLSLENYDLQAVYEPPATALELDGTSSPSDSSSVIAISEGEEEENRAGGRSEERLQGMAGGAHDNVIQTGSCLSLSAWDDETPGPSYSTAEPSCSLASLSFSPAPQEAANEEGGEKREEEGEEECLIVGYKKPIAERTPELVQLSSDTEEEEDKEKEKEEKTAEKLPPLPSTTPPLSYLPIIPPSTSGAYLEEQDDKSKERDEEEGGRRSRARSWSGSSGRSRVSVCTLSPSERRRESWRDRKRSGSEAAREKKRRKRKRRGRERSGTLYNPNRSIYPAMMRRHSHSPSPFQSSVESGSPLPPSPPDSSWEYRCSPVTSSVSSPSRSSSSSPLCSSPQPSSPPPQTPPTPSLSPGDAHHREKPGGKRKYKSRHLDSDDKDPTWRPSSSHRRERRRERREKERRRRRRERQRRDAHRESSSYYGESSSRRCREDRSPSVEIIYEGTITPDATQPPARKRRRKRHRKTQHSSSPVIITLDSDSSHDDINNSKNVNSSSSSPLSSQQTVDFSDLPPLPLVHSAGVGGALDAEIGELPVDILDRSDGSETEPVGQSEAAGPIAVDNSDNSDRDVDVENVEDSGSLLGCNDDEGLPSSICGPIRKVVNSSEAMGVDAGSQRTGSDDSAAITTALRKRNSEVTTSDSRRLLATILSDLKGFAAPQRDLSLSFERSCSPDTRKRRILDPCEANRAHSDQDSWLRDRGQTCQTSSPPPPPLQRLKASRVGEEGLDVPPLLKQASPVRSYNRNTPPPLKHKDAGSPRLHPPDLHPLHTSFDVDPLGVNPPVDVLLNPHVDSRFSLEVPKENQAIPPISTLKRHFTNALALRGELSSASSNPCADMLSSCHLAPIDSLSAAPSNATALTPGIHSPSHQPPAEARSSSGSGDSTGADCSARLNSFHSPKLHSSHDGTKAVSSPGLRSSPVNLHPVNSLSPTDFHSAKTGWSKEKPAHTDSTSGGCRNKPLGLKSCRAVPADLHLSGSVCAGGAPTGGGVFSGVNSNDTSPAVLLSSLDSRTQNPSPPFDSRSASSVPTAAPGSRMSPFDSHPPSPKSTADLRSSSAALEGLIDGESPSAVNHDDGSPRGRPPPPSDLHSSRVIGAMIDGHLNHTASPSSSLHPPHRKCSSHSEPTLESYSNLHHAAASESQHRNHVSPSPPSQFPTDSRPPVDLHSKSSQLHTDNHIASSPRSVENQWNSRSDSPADGRSAGSVWTTHTRSAT